MASVLYPHPTFLNRRKSTKRTQLSVIGKVVAGLPISMITNIEDYPFFPEYTQEKDNIFMIPANTCHVLDPDILDQDYLIVRKQTPHQRIRTRRNSLVLISSGDQQMQVLPWHKQQAKNLTTPTFIRKEKEQMLGQIIGILRPCSPSTEQ